MLAPDAVATSVLSFSRCSRAYSLAPATASAPAGSSTAGVLENVLDRRADGVGVDQHHLVDIHLAEAEGLLADVLDRSTVGEQADMVETDTLAGLERARHGVGVDGFDADDSGLRPTRLMYAATPEIRPPPPTQQKTA
jgi:hypothetical protein